MRRREQYSSFVGTRLAACRIKTEMRHPHLRSLPAKMLCV
jgi:hypothetical protein